MNKHRKIRKQFRDGLRWQKNCPVSKLAGSLDKVLFDNFYGQLHEQLNIQVGGNLGGQLGAPFGKL